MSALTRTFEPIWLKVTVPEVVFPFVGVNAAPAEGPCPWVAQAVSELTRIAAKSLFMCVLIKVKNSPHQWPHGGSVSRPIIETKTDCTQGTRLVNRSFNETVQVDVNENNRSNYAYSCRVNLCIKRFGNKDCESPK